MKLWSCISLFLSYSFVFCFPTFGIPVDSLKGEKLKVPFKNCTLYTLGRAGVPLTHAVPLQDGAQLVFYPMTEADVLYIFLNLEETSFRVTVSKTRLTLERCRKRYSCTLEDEEDVKYIDYFKSHFWNLVRVYIAPQKELTVYVGPLVLKSKSPIQGNFSSSTWSVSVEDRQPIKTFYSDNDLLFVIQYKCEEFIREENLQERHTTPFYYNPSVPTPVHVTEYLSGAKGKPVSDINYDPHHKVFPEHTTEFSPYSDSTTYRANTLEPHSDLYIGLIVGLVILAVIAVVVANVVYKVIKKRRSANITEDSPLTDQQRKEDSKKPRIRAVKVKQQQ